MKVRSTRQGLTVQGIAGTHVVMLGFDMPKEACGGLAGFAVHRTDHEAEESYWLEGLKTFKETDPGLPAGAKYSTLEHPIQGFTWSDFAAKPGRNYTYRVVALKGQPTEMEREAEVAIEVETEAPETGDHDVYFNRGAAASQEYSRRFGKKSPAQVGKAAFTWLSRGLYEGMADFIERATGSGHELLVCAYEFHYAPILEALKGASDRGVKVRIVYDKRGDAPGKKNAAAISKAKLSTLATARTEGSAISHNKFIVHVQGGAPKAVLTGGTNFSEGGIFGHSNGIHVVEQDQVAARYVAYFELLAEDPTSADLRPQVEELFEVPGELPRRGASVVFSPRGDQLTALEWYASLAASARSGLLMTFAFGMHELFQDVYRTGQAPMRYALLEKATRPMKAGPEKVAAEKAIRLLRQIPENRFAIGAHLRMNSFDRWLGERLSGLNRNVQYTHTKYMLIDPLGDDPIVVSGSANFSKASTNDNDENMLVIRGNKRVAHIYLGEFMRLYNHYAFREWAARRNAADPELKHLRTDDWWREYFGATERSRQREFFVS